MIGVDLLRKGLVVADGRAYLGSPDEWVGLTIGEIVERLRADGYVIESGMTLESLIEGMTERKLVREAGWEPRPDPVEEVPPGGEALKLQGYSCAQGHVWQAYEPYRWQTRTEPRVQTGSLCPYCVIEFADKAFPAR